MLEHSDCGPLPITLAGAASGGIAFACGMLDDYTPSLEGGAGAVRCAHKV